MQDRRKLARGAGIAVLAVWALLFLAGALGEILEIDGLRSVAEFPRRLFLR